MKRSGRVYPKNVKFNVQKSNIVFHKHSKIKHCISHIERCCSVVKSCLTLCNPMDCSTSDFPVLHYLPEFAQSHDHWVSDAIEPSHPLLPPSPPAFNLSQHQDLSSESAPRIRWPRSWSFSFSSSLSDEYQGLISFRIDWFDLLAVQWILSMGPIRI